MINTWGQGLSDSFRGVGNGVLGIVPNIIAAILVIIIGWVIGALFSRIVSQIFKSAKVDDGLKKAGVDEMLQKGGVKLNSGKFVGELVEWFIIIVFMVAAFDILGLVQVNIFLQQVVLLYLPRVIVAVLILLVSALIGEAMKKLVATSAKTAGLRSAHLLGTLTKWAIWIFAILVALSQVGIAAGFVQTLFTGFVVAISLGLGLAFGLGGQNAASEVIAKFKQEVSEKHY